MVTNRRRRGPRAMSKRGKMNQVGCGGWGVTDAGGNRSDEDATDGVQEKGLGDGMLDSGG